MCFNQLVGLAQPAPAIVAAIPVPGPLAPMAMLVVAGLPNALMPSAVFVDGMPGVELPYASTSALLVALNQAGVVIVEGLAPDGSAQVGIGPYTALLGTTGLVTAPQAAAFVGRLGNAVDGKLLFYDPKQSCFLDPAADRPAALHAPRCALLPLIARIFGQRLDLLAPEITFPACLALVDAHASNVPAPPILLASSAVLRYFWMWLATTFVRESVVRVDVVGGQQPCYQLADWVAAVLPVYNHRLRVNALLHLDPAALNSDTRAKLLFPVTKKVNPATYWAVPVAGAVPVTYASVQRHDNQPGAVEVLSVEAAAVLFYHYFSPELVPGVGLIVAQALVATATFGEDFGRIIAAGAAADPHRADDDGQEEEVPMAHEDSEDADPVVPAQRPAKRPRAAASRLPASWDDNNE